MVEEILKAALWRICGASPVCLGIIILDTK
jgi:hypothetical protein